MTSGVMILPEQRCIVLTPLGRGAVATVLVEGPGAREAVQAVFRAAAGRALDTFTPDRPVLGRVGESPGEEVILRCRSDESVELHCHGGTAAVSRLESLFARRGFTSIDWRAWLTAREADPFAAAARLALADACTTRTAAILLDQYHGALRRAFEEIETTMATREKGRGDRGEGTGERGERRGAQNFTFHTPPSALETLPSLRQRIEALQTLIPLGRHLTSPWRVVLAGRPNVGKSSLLNALVGYGRVIVHERPGTTRDAVTVQTALDGWPVELCDTAGLGASTTLVERTGVQLAEQKMREAELQILTTDASQSWAAEDQSLQAAWPRALLVHNKCDLTQLSGTRPPGLFVSALSGQGIENLAERIARRLVPHPPPPGTAVPFSEVQFQQIENWAKKLGKST
jgi:tRNA modification GTPase